VHLLEQLTRQLLFGVHLQGIQGEPSLVDSCNLLLMDLLIITLYQTGLVVPWVSLRVGFGATGLCMGWVCLEQRVAGGCQRRCGLSRHGTMP
jgi:hypothetical protein